MIFPPQFQALIEPLFVMEQSYAIWWMLRGKKHATSYQREVGKFPGFLVSTANAHFLSFVIAANQLLDRRKGTHSLANARHKYLLKHPPVARNTQTHLRQLGFEILGNSMA